MVENKKPNCGMYNDEDGCCPKDCDDCWPTCAICGAMFPFWNGESHNELNGYVIIEGGFQCSDRELEGDEDLVCKGCYQQHIKPLIDALKANKVVKSCRSCGKGQMAVTSVYCTTHEGDKCGPDKGYEKWIPKTKGS